MVVRIWCVISALIGGAILVLLAFYGVEYGTWVDEVGRLPITPPTVILPLIIGALALLLLLGGLLVAALGRGR